MSAYDPKRTLACISCCEAKPVSVLSKGSVEPVQNPPKANRSRKWGFPVLLYRNCNVIECNLCGLADFRSIAIRGDLMAGNVLAVAYFVDDRPWPATGSGS